MDKFWSALCCIICLIFDLLIIGGALILISGVAMYLFKTGTNTAFYKFFNDSPIGWAIIFGFIIAGGVGRFATAKIMDRVGISSIWDYLPAGSSGSVSSSNSYTSYKSDSSSDSYDSSYTSNSSYDSSDSSSSSSWPYEYGTMRDSYGNETEVTHNTITDTYTDNYGHEYKSDDGGNTFYEVDDD